MRSIGKKILRITLCWLIIVIFIMSSVSVIVVSKLSRDNSETILLETCDKETLRFDNEFEFLENSVTTISEYVYNYETEAPSEDALLTDNFCDKVQAITLSIARRTDSAMAVYFRYNPELVGSGTKGFFWSRDNEDEDFVCLEPTDILQYDPDDTEHVGWFYEPKENGKAMWMSPYYNENLDVFMISYVIPYYTQSGNFLGVIGMDIDFNKIVKLTENEALYETGRINLADLTTSFIYGIDEGKNVYSEDMSTVLYDKIKNIDEKNKMLSLTDSSGTSLLVCISPLSNGMKLIISVPTDEINAQRNSMLLTLTLIMIVTLAITSFFIIRFTSKIIDPLKKLTQITEEYAKGNWEETYICDTGDEIQELSESISIMAETTKSYIKKLNDGAMTDALTGLKNRNCYLSYITKLDEESRSSAEGYAVLVFDINFLKRTNDNFGHEAGDLLIRRAGGYICDVFAHSPVFRIGGDEFVAILRGRDYDSREDLCHHFIPGLEKLPPIAEDLHVSIAFGMACFKVDGQSYDELFQCADLRMYAMKKEMKGGRE